MELTDVLLTLAGLVTAGIILKNRAVTQPDWDKLPTLPEYLARHPECATDDSENASCCACGSHKVLFQPADRRRRLPFAPHLPGLRQGAVSQPRHSLTGCHRHAITVRLLLDGLTFITTKPKQHEGI
ncbi:hypothetical protein ACSZN6_15030 [Aeromonas hydrophila]